MNESYLSNVGEAAGLLGALLFFYVTTQLWLAVEGWIKAIQKRGAK